MADPILIALIAAIPPTVAALASLRISLKNGQKSDAIHILVDGRLSTALEEIESLKATIQSLRIGK